MRGPTARVELLWAEVTTVDGGELIRALATGVSGL